VRHSLWWCVVHRVLFTVRRGGVSFVVVHCGGVSWWWCLVCGVSRVGLPVSFRAMTWRQASPLGRGDVGARCQPPAGD
jgi:hypothetical protein